MVAAPGGEVLNSSLYWLFTFVYSYYHEGCLFPHGREAAQNETWRLRLS
jgi:hypothetical protein